MYFLQKILVVLFILISGSLKAGEVTDLYENEEFDAAYRLGYAQALNGDPESLFIIGKILIGGEGSSEENVKKGLKFIKFAADDNYQKAIIFSAEAYEEGELIKQNNDIALKYYERCAENGSLKCKKKRDKLYIKLTGEISKKTCKTYNKKDKKLANKIARCIVSGYLEGNASSYYLISFDKGNTNDFIRAANRMLKPDSDANLKILIKKLPEFYRKAKKTHIKKLSNTAKKYGYDFKSCNIKIEKKDRLGFNKNKNKGNVEACVFAAIAGDSEASAVVAKWWRDGLKGLPKDKNIAKIMIKKATSGKRVNYAGVLKSLENNPREHFIQARKFIETSPISKKIVAKELKFEARLIAAGKELDFAKEARDIAFVLSNVNWLGLKSTALADIHLLYYTEYQQYKEIASSLKVKDNFKKIPFSKDLYIKLVRAKNENAGELALKFLKQKMLEDCKALEYASESDSVSNEYLRKAQKKMGNRCMQIAGSSKKSMEELMMEAEIDFERKRTLIENRLNANKPCLDYKIFLKNKHRLSTNADYLEINLKKLNKKCAKNEAVIYEKAKEAYFSGNYDEAHDLSEQSCKLKKSTGCEILASIIKDQKSIRSQRMDLNKVKGRVIYYLEKGHASNDDKSTAMLYDLYNQAPLLSAYSNFSMAEKYIGILSNKKSTAARVRQKADCFSNRKVDIVKFFSNDCRPVCIWAEEEFMSKNKEEKYDIASLNAIEDITNNPICCPEGAGQCSKKKSKKSNISNFKPNQ